MRRTTPQLRGEVATQEKSYLPLGHWQRTPTNPKVDQMKEQSVKTLPRARNVSTFKGDIRPPREEGWTYRRHPMMLWTHMDRFYQKEVTE